MSQEEDDFLRAILEAPDDAAVRLVYADWLEERGDPRAELLRLAGPLQHGQQEEEAAAAEAGAGPEAAVDPAWVAFLTTLGQPFRSGPVSRDFFDCEPARLPFTEHIGRRGRIVTFESHFRQARSWEPNLPRDLLLLTRLELGECWAGAGSIPVHPFLCELATDRQPLRAADVLAALNARDFRSRHILSLDATSIPYPGYHPSGGRGVDNDEIHNDSSEQYIFQRPADAAAGEEEGSGEAVDEQSGVHGLLKRSVVDGQLWYVLLHTTPHQVAELLYSDYVVLFAVGRSVNGPRLLGVVTHQVCHNLCD